MVKQALIFLLSLLITSQLYAQGANNGAVVPPIRHVRISLMTVGQGDMIWEAFGHSCIRVIDSAREGKMHDLVFNYGTFDNFDQNFGKKLMDGTLLYYLSVFPYDFFANVFVEKGRSLKEQVLVLNDRQRTDLANNLEVNTLPQNKYYHYDFFTDNCCTRIYDMVAKTLGTGFVPGDAIPKGEPISFYEGSYQYYQYRHWERTGIALLFEHRMNMPVTDADVLFLPDYLSKAFDKATLNGKKAVETPVIFATDTRPQHKPLNGPLIFTSVIAMLTIAGLSWRPARLPGNIMSYAVLFMSGLLGCIMLYAWFGTTHSGCEDNLNLLWALPTNLVIIFFKPAIRAKYALAGIILLCLCIILYMLRIMVMPLIEITPFLLSLVWVYAAMYRRTLSPTAMACNHFPHHFCCILFATAVCFWL